MKKETSMTGSEAWNLVSPILAQLVDLTKNTEYIEAYTTVYRALKKLDEKGGCEGCEFIKTNER